MIQKTTRYLCATIFFVALTSCGGDDSSNSSSSGNGSLDATSADNRFLTPQFFAEDKEVKEIFGSKAVKGVKTSFIFRSRRGMPAIDATDTFAGDCAVVQDKVRLENNTLMVSLVVDEGQCAPEDKKYENSTATARFYGEFSCSDTDISKYGEYSANHLAANDQWYFCVDRFIQCLV